MRLGSVSISEQGLPAAWRRAAASAVAAERYVRQTAMTKNSR